MHILQELVWGRIITLEVFHELFCHILPCPPCRSSHGDLTTHGDERLRSSCQSLRSSFRQRGTYSGVRRGPRLQGHHSTPTRTGQSQQRQEAFSLTLSGTFRQSLLLSFCYMYTDICVCLRTHCREVYDSKGFASIAYKVPQMLVSTLD